MIKSYCQSMNRLLVAFCLFFIVTPLSAQQGSFLKERRPLVEISVKKTGPYIGIQRGKYTVLEFGVERQWKQVKLIKPQIHAAHMGFNYNFRYNMLGYDIGYWYKPHRIGLTYGTNLFFRTNFTDNRFGIAPVIGFKFWFLHLQTGYHFMAPLPNDFQTNRFFISLRMGIINDRDWDFKWAWQKDGKKKKKKR